MRTGRTLWVPLTALAVCAAVISCGKDPLEIGSETCARQYPISQLQVWYNRVGVLFEIEGVTMTDMDEVKQCVAIGIADLSIRGAVVKRIDELEIPRDAVYIQIVPMAEDRTRLDR